MLKARRSLASRYTTMILLLSPTKTLDESRMASPPKCVTQPRFAQGEAPMKSVLENLQKLSKPKLKSLLGVSDSLATLNHKRYSAFDDQPAKPCMWMYKGPAFQALSPQGFSEEAVEYAQGHVRILSGLYGLLRPCDEIKPYRIDMGKKLAIGDCKNLYEFWKPRIASVVSKDLVSPQNKPRIVVSCASNEYLKALDTSLLDDDIEVVQCAFQEPSGRSASVYAKRARGMMVRFAIEKQADSIEHLKEFQGYPDLETYKFSESKSTANTLVFVRQSCSGSSKPKPKPKPKGKVKKKEEGKTSVKATAKRKGSGEKTFTSTKRRNKRARA
ncbi:hypothetical protein AAMO2058_000543700 [Amorphochlora amoebiformis]